MNRHLVLAAAALITGLTLTACGTTSDTPDDNTADYATTVTATPARNTTPDTSANLDQQDLTRLSINATWNASTPADQRNMCNGITLFGTDWAADQLRQGASDSDILDWDYAAQLIEGKCEL